MILFGCLAITHLICLGNQAMSTKCDKREKPQNLLQRLIMCTVASVLASGWMYKIIETRPTVPLDKLHCGERGIWQQLYRVAYMSFCFAGVFLVRDCIVRRLLRIQDLQCLFYELESFRKWHFWKDVLWHYFQRKFQFMWMIYS